MPISQDFVSLNHDLNNTGYIYPEDGVGLNIAPYTDARLSVIAGNDALTTAVVALEVSIDGRTWTEAATQAQAGQSGSVTDITGWRWARLRTKMAEGDASRGTVTLYVENTQV